MAGGRGIEDNVLKPSIILLLFDELRDALQHRRLMSAGRVPRQVHVPVDLAVQTLRHETTHLLGDALQVLLRRPRRVDLDDA